MSKVINDTQTDLYHEFNALIVNLKMEHGTKNCIAPIVKAIEEILIDCDDDRVNEVTDSSLKSYIKQHCTKKKLSYNWKDKHDKIYTHLKRGESIVTTSTSFGFPEKSKFALQTYIATKFGDRDNFIKQHEVKLKIKIVVEKPSLTTEQMVTSRSGDLPKQMDKALELYLLLIENEIGAEKAAELRLLSVKMSKVS